MKYLFEDEENTTTETEPEFDLDLDVFDDSQYYKVVFEDDNYQIVRPRSEEGFRILADGTPWVGDDDNSNNNWRLRNIDRIFVILDKNNKKKKWLFYAGYSSLTPASKGWSTSSVGSWAYKHGSREMWKWFIDQNFAYVSTNLRKKVEADLLKEKTVFVYPDDDSLAYSTRIKLPITKIEIKEGTTILKRAAFSGLRQVTSVEIPDSVKRFGKYCFSSMESLKTVSFSGSIKEIPEGCFYMCKNLENIDDLLDGVTKIGSWSLGGCEKLKITKLPDTLEYIGYRAFSHINTEVIEIPSSVSYIGGCAFSGKVKKIYIPSSVSKVDYAILSTDNVGWLGGTLGGTTVGGKTIYTGKSDAEGWSQKFDDTSCYHNNDRKWPVVYNCSLEEFRQNSRITEELDLEFAPELDVSDLNDYYQGNLYSEEIVPEEFWKEWRKSSGLERLNKIFIPLYADKKVWCFATHTPFGMCSIDGELEQFKGNLSKYNGMFTLYQILKLNKTIKADLEEAMAKQEIKANTKDYGIYAIISINDDRDITKEIWEITLKTQGLQSLLTLKII